MNCKNQLADKSSFLSFFGRIEESRTFQKEKQGRSDFESDLVTV